MSVRDIKRFIVCFRHNKICEAESYNYSNNKRTNNFLRQHVGRPIAYLNQDELSEYSTKRFRELLYMFKKEKN